MKRLSSVRQLDIEDGTTEYRTYYKTSDDETDDWVSPGKPRGTDDGDYEKW